MKATKQGTQTERTKKSENISYPKDSLDHLLHPLELYPALHSFLIETHNHFVDKALDHLLHPLELGHPLLLIWWRCTCWRQYNSLALCLDDTINPILTHTKSSRKLRASQGLKNWVCPNQELWPVLASWSCESKELERTWPSCNLTEGEVSWNPENIAFFYCSIHRLCSIWKHNLYSAAPSQNNSVLCCCWVHMRCQHWSLRQKLPQKIRIRSLLIQ